MKLDLSSNEPIFIQIANRLEDLIFTKIFLEEQKIPSTTELSATLSINPHTVLKGMNLLVDEDILYKKRGLGMFVKAGAVDKIKNKRKNNFKENFIKTAVDEAKKLSIPIEELIKIIEREFYNE